MNVEVKQICYLETIQYIFNMYYLHDKFLKYSTNDKKTYRIKEVENIYCIYN